MGNNLSWLVKNMDTLHFTIYPIKEVILLKQPAALRRILPLLVVTALCMSLAVPVSALFGFGESESGPTVATFSKNGLANSPITFSADDFVVSGNATLDSVVVTTLPDPGAGMLVMSGQPIAAGDTVAMSAISGLRFQPLAAPVVAVTAFSFTPLFSDGTAGDAVSVSVYLLSAKNESPIAENLNFSTYKNVAITERFAATDPEGDLITFQLIQKPARGAVTMPTDGSNQFVYTPYENKTGKDTFTYVAVDAVGNASAPATVKVTITKASTKVTYADMDGVPSYKAAIRLAEEGIFVGETIDGQYFFRPNTPVTRSEFLAMTMKASDMKSLADVTTTGFADDLVIPTWAKAYAAAALKSGVVLGAAQYDGQIVFSADAPITRAEASVILNRALQITDVTQTMLSDAEIAPVWAVQAAANLQTCGILQTNSTGTLGLNDQLTRGAAAEMVLGALEVLDSRDSGGLFNW